MMCFSYNTKKDFQLRSLASLIALICAGGVRASDYYFDPSLFQGSVYGQNLAQFNQQDSTVIPGSYLVDIYVNQKLIKSGEKVDFSQASGQKEKTAPCLTRDLIKLARIKSRQPLAEIKSDCLLFSELVPDGSWQFEQANLQLYLTVPNDAMKHIPRGYIPPSEWDSGAMALFLRHNTSYTRMENDNNHYKYNYLWSGLNAGTNLGLWQLRHQGNLRYTDSQLNGGKYRYNSVRTWVQRPIPELESVISLGDNYTDSSLFGSLSFNGIKLATDERMWPQGKRGYAPEIRGIASSSARVIVKQLGKVIYETNVAPGPFVISDLYNTQNQGDLFVEVVEANGKSSTFTVPYSAVPDSVRPGNWHYSLALGRVRQYYSVENAFFEGVVQRGVSNSLTANVGVRAAENYQAWLLGGVYSTGLGAVGLNTTWSSARVENGEQQQGWRAEVSYSKTFNTGTNLVLAAWRYSTSGFRDLQDVLGVRRQQESGVEYYSDTLHQRNRLSATVSQPLQEYGTLNLSASTADYYDNSSRITQLQLGYSNQWRGISYGINIARQRTAWNIGRSGPTGWYEDSDESSQQKYTENTFSLNISVPFSWGENRSSLAFNYNQSRATKSATTSLTGSLGKYNDLTYSVYGGMDRSRNGGGDSLSWGATAQQNTRVGGLRASWDRGNNYKQLGLGASGTVVLHSGGITAGPYASETFALIHAEGAQGAAVQNGQGAVIDRFGYAILPSLSPYRNNTVSLDTAGMRNDVELSGGSQRVVPYAGAIARVNFATLRGQAVFINLRQPDGAVPPMGAEVRDGEGTIIGMVGQGGQIYARIAHPSGTLQVKWGPDTSQRCRIRYQLPSANGDDFVHLNQTCQKG